jgi:hypothetical protein
MINVPGCAKDEMPCGPVVPRVVNCFRTCHVTIIKHRPPVAKWTPATRWLS